jgi:hypothetical protein
MFINFDPNFLVEKNTYVVQLKWFLTGFIDYFQYNFLQWTLNYELLEPIDSRTLE